MLYVSFWYKLFTLIILGFIGKTLLDVAYGFPANHPLDHPVIGALGCLVYTMAGVFIVYTRTKKDGKY